MCQSEPKEHTLRTPVRAWGAIWRRIGVGGGGTGVPLGRQSGGCTLMTDDANDTGTWLNWVGDETQVFVQPGTAFTNMLLIAEGQRTKGSSQFPIQVQVSTMQAITELAELPMPNSSIKF